MDLAKHGSTIDQMPKHGEVLSSVQHFLKLFG